MLALGGGFSRAAYAGNLGDFKCDYEYEVVHGMDNDYTRIISEQEVAWVYNNKTYIDSSSGGDNDNPTVETRVMQDWVRHPELDARCAPLLPPTPPPPPPPYGVKNAVAVPFLADYSDAFYPFAKRPDGCSVPYFNPGKWDNWRLSVAGIGYQISFTDACNSHDKCFYTLNSDFNTCEASFEADLRAACERGLHSASGILVGLAGGLETCYAKAEVFYGATASPVGRGLFEDAQKKQRRYFDVVNAIIP